MNKKELDLFLKLFANEQGISKENALEWVTESFAAYANKKVAQGKGTFTAEYNEEENVFEITRHWTLVADDVVMEDPDNQWRIMDAMDEGLDNAEAGDVVSVREDNLEMTRQFKTWMYQHMLRKNAELKKRV